MRVLALSISSCRCIWQSPCTSIKLKQSKRGVENMIACMHFLLDTASHSSNKSETRLAAALSIKSSSAPHTPTFMDPNLASMPLHLQLQMEWVQIDRSIYQYCRIVATQSAYSNHPECKLLWLACRPNALFRASLAGSDSFGKIPLHFRV